MVETKLSGPYAVLQELIVGGFMLAAGYQFFPEVVMGFLPVVGMAAGGAMVASAAILATRPSDVIGKVKQVFKSRNVCVGEQYPKLLRFRQTPNGYRLEWHLPPGLALSDLLTHRERIEQATGAEVEMYFDKGRVVMHLYGLELPDRIGWQQYDLEGKLPLVIGYSKLNKGLVIRLPLAHFVCSIGWPCNAQEQGHVFLGNTFFFS